MMAWWPRWLGRLFLETTVAYNPGGQVHHTTTIYWLGIPMMKSAETVFIEEDGTSFRVQGESVASMMPWRKLPMTGAGEIDSTGCHATYRLNWMGTTVIQDTDRTDEGVVLRQAFPGFQGIQELRAAAGKGA